MPHVLGGLRLFCFFSASSLSLRLLESVCSIVCDMVAICLMAQTSGARQKEGRSPAPAVLRQRPRWRRRELRRKMQGPLCNLGGFMHDHVKLVNLLIISVSAINHTSTSHYPSHDD